MESDFSKGGDLRCKLCGTVFPSGSHHHCPREWQGMDSAPMDGTPLLLFARCVTATAPIILVGNYYPLEDQWIEVSFKTPVGVEPYFWQALPSFPLTPPQGE